MVAFDASCEMCRLASKLIGQTVHQKSFDDIDWISEFDGIWACASLLHLRRNSIDTVLHKLRHALKPNGIMFVSFKFRDGEWEEGGRFFNGYDQTSFQQLIRGHPALACTSMWVSEDVRPDRKGKMWLNAIVQNVRGETG